MADDADADDAVQDAIAAVVADELLAQMLVRRNLSEIPSMIAYELVRGFDISGELVGGVAAPVDDWPVVRHVTVDRHDRAHIELASFQWLRDGEQVQFDLPSGGSIAVRQAEDGTIQEIVIWPASRLLPADVQADGPQPTSAADAE